MRVSLAVAMATQAGCDQPKPEMLHDVADTPTPVPAKIGPVEKKSKPAKQEGKDDERIKQCVPGTG